MSQEDFINYLFQQNSKSFSTFPNKELAEEFIDQLFDFLFLPKTIRHRQASDLIKDYEGLKSHFSSLVYDVLHDGVQTQDITNQFFGSIPNL